MCTNSWGAWDKCTRSAGELPAATQPKNVLFGSDGRQIVGAPLLHMQRGSGIWKSMISRHWNSN